MSLMNKILIFVIILVVFFIWSVFINVPKYFDATSTNSVCDDHCDSNFSIHGLILARKGSKGILHKNLAMINGQSLLARSITTMIKFKKFAAVWVSTDGEDIAKEAEKHGAKVHWRDEATATDTATSVMAMQEFLQAHSEVEKLVLVQCTSPFLLTKYLEQGYKLVLQGYDSVFTVTREHKLRWMENTDEEIVPLNFNPLKRPRRQDGKGELVENGMFYFTSRKYIENGVIQAGRIGVVEIPKYYNLEIDNSHDLAIARLLSNLSMFR